MKNYFIIDGEKIPISEETAKALAGKIKKTKTYEDIAHSLFDDKYCYFITTDGEASKIVIRGNGAHAIDPNNAPTKEQLESILAVNKLANVAKYLNGNWLPDFTKNQKNYYILYNTREDKFIITYNIYFNEGVVSFKTRDLAKKAIEILGKEEILKALTLNY